MASRSRPCADDARMLKVPVFCTTLRPADCWHCAITALLSPSLHFEPTLSNGPRCYADAPSCNPSLRHTLSHSGQTCEHYTGTNKEVHLLSDYDTPSLHVAQCMPLSPARTVFHRFDNALTCKNHVANHQRAKAFIAVTDLAALLQLPHNCRWASPRSFRSTHAFLSNLSLQA